MRNWKRMNEELERTNEKLEERMRNWKYIIIKLSV
jgi:FtsZ-binding cell division protein ZapB